MAYDILESETQGYEVLEPEEPAQPEPIRPASTREYPMMGDAFGDVVHAERVAADPQGFVEGLRAVPRAALNLVGQAASRVLNAPEIMRREESGTPQRFVIDTERNELRLEDKPLPFRAGQPVAEFDKTVLQPEGNVIQRLVEGLATPENLALIPFAASKPVQAAFLTEMAPATVEAAAKTFSPDVPLDERRDAATEALLNGLMSYGLARHLTKPRVAGEPYAEAVFSDQGPIVEAGQIPQASEVVSRENLQRATPRQPEPVAARVEPIPEAEKLPAEQPQKVETPTDKWTPIDNVTDPFHKYSWLEKIANAGRKSSDEDLIGVLDRIEKIEPEVGSNAWNVAWAVSQNPAASAKTKARALDMREKWMRPGREQSQLESSPQVQTVETVTPPLEKPLTPVSGEQKPTAAAPEAKLSKTSKEFDRLVLEHAIQAKWVRDPNALYETMADVKSGHGTASIKSKILKSAEMKIARRNAARELGVEPSEVETVAGRAALAERLRQHVESKYKEVAPETQTADFSKAIQTGKKEVPVEELQVGQTLNVKGEPVKVIKIDPDTHDVTVQDGTRFGTQVLKDGSKVYAEEWAKSTPETPVVPKIREGEKGTAEIFQGEDQPFNLAGETAKDFERIAAETRTREQAQREAAELQSKQQPELVGMGEPVLSRPGPGAASPAEFAQRQSSANRTPPPPNPPVTIEPGQSPSAEVVRANKDYNLFNRINSPQWLYYFGKLGQSAKSAWETMVLGEFKMRESVKRDVKQFVEDTLKSLPRPFRKDGGKAMFDVLDGKTMEQIEGEWRGRPEGEQVIAQAQKVKTRLEEIRTNIRDIKRDSFRKYLVGADKATLENLFRENINRDVDVSKMTKEQMSDALALEQFPDDWGIADGSYLPHLFFGQWKVSARLPGAESPQFITRAQTIQEAKARIYEQTQANPELRNAQFDISQDTIIPADMIRLGDRRFWHLVGEMKERNMSESDVRDALRGNIGRKAAKQKWFGSLQERKGASGYSQEFSRVMGAYLSGFHRWRVLTEVNREVQPLIEQVRREGRVNAAENLDHLMDNLWGKPSKTTKEFDAAVRQVPMLRDYIKPLALDRWSRFARNMTGLLTLRTARFALVNRLQPLQGLYPIIGERGLVQAKIMQHSKEGRRLLDEAGVTFDPGQYATPGAPFGRTREIMERLSGERTNQEVAFLGMYNHARKLGLGHEEAINYGKLRGQLMTQFTPLITDSPALFEGPIGQVMFQFKRFPVKQVELMAKMASDKNVPAIIRMLGTFGLLGGLSFYLRQTWFSDNDTRLKLKRSLDKEYGTQVADTLMYGLPGFVGADISGSITLGDEPIGSNIYEKAARALTGPAISLGIETAKAATADTRTQRSPQEQAEALLRRLPALKPLAEASAMIRGDVDLLTPDGEVKLRRTLADAIAGLGAFRSANEANVSLAVNGIMALRQQESQLQNALYVATQSGDPEAKQEALKAIEAFNAQWPEAKITEQDRNRYLANRKARESKTDAERVAGKRHLKLLPASQTSK